MPRSLQTARVSCRVCGDVRVAHIPASEDEDLPCAACGFLAADVIESLGTAGLAQCTNCEAWLRREEVERFDWVTLCAECVGWATGA